MYINKESVAKRIREIRLANDLSVTDFAKKLDVHKTAVSNWEHAKNLPSDEKIEMIAKIFQWDYEYIKFGTIRNYIEDLFNEHGLDPTKYETEIAQLVDSLNEEDVKNSNKIKYITFKAKQLINLLSDSNKDNDEKHTSQILNNPSFEKVYIPLLDHLLYKDMNSKTNDEIIKFFLDLLSRMNPSQKEELLNIIKNLNWLFTNNIFVLEKTHQTDKPRYGSITSESYESKINRLKDEKGEILVDNEASNIMLDIMTSMKNIYESNKEDYKNNKYRTIF